MKSYRGRQHFKQSKERYSATCPLPQPPPTFYLYLPSREGGSLWNIKLGLVIVCSHTNPKWFFVLINLPPASFSMGILIIFKTSRHILIFKRLMFGSHTSTVNPKGRTIIRNLLTSSEISGWFSFFPDVLPFWPGVLSRGWNCLDLDLTHVNKASTRAMSRS